MLNQTEVSINNLEISIEKDTNHQKADLKSMPLEVAQAFSIIVDSLTRIVENSPNKHTLKVKVLNGTVKVGLEGEGLTEVKNDFLQAIDNQSSDKAVVNSWKNIQQLFKKNGLTYGSEAIIDNQTIHLITSLKNADPLRVKKRKSPPIQTEIEFITGELFQVGGKKNTNLHIEKESGKVSIVECSREVADNAKEYLYKTVQISAWQIPGLDKEQHVFCDSYFKGEYYDTLKSFIEKLESMDDGIKSLELLHFEVRRYLEAKDYKGFKRFLNLFNYPNINSSILHTILMLTTSFRNVDLLSDVLQNMYAIFDKQIKKQSRKPNRVENN